VSKSLKNQKSSIEWGVLVLILLLAAFLRLYRLDSVPPGLTHDEADTGYFAASVYRGAPSQAQGPYGYINEPFTQHSGALFMALLGPTDLALRVHSAFWGMVLLMFAYLWAKRVFGVAVGSGGAAMIAVSFWTISNSRFALNSEPAPALFTGAVYFLWRAMDDEGSKHWWSWGLFAVFLAGSLYAYEAARAATLALGVFFIYLALTDRPGFRLHGAWFAGALVLAGALAAPHLLNSNAWGRSSTLSVPLQAALRGDLQPLLANVISALGTISFRGDSFITYNLPGRPILDPIASLFFYGGIALCLRRWRNPVYAFTLLWIAAGLAPSLVLGEWTSTLHSKAAEAPILVLPAVCAVEVGRCVAARFGSRWAKAFTAGCVAWLAVIALSTGYDYFIRWGQSPATRAAYFHNLSAITDYLNRTPYSGAVALSSPFPDLPLDPFIADLRVHRNDLSLYWFDAQRALMFPDAARSLMIVPPSTPLPPELAGRLDLRKIERVNLRPDDVDPYFDVFEWSPREALARFTSNTQTIVAGGRTHDLPMSLGAVELVAYELPAQTIAPGETITLMTVWRVRDPAALGPVPAHDYGHSLAIFAHLLDANDAVVSQEDRLDAPAWDWRAGDAIAQVHSFSIATAVPPGSYTLEVGIYTRESLTRLPVLVDGITVDNRVLLPPVQVVSP
jgi:4-amino-4-deoxy-L-arabinose transferase-like glycosyltransferase